MQNKRINKELSEETIQKLRQNPKCGKWMVISRQMNLTKEFCYEFRDYIKWNQLVCWRDLSEDFIREFIDYIPFKDLYQNQSKNLSYDFMIEYKNKMCWPIVFMNKILHIRHDIDDNNINEKTIKEYEFLQKTLKYIKKDDTREYYREELEKYNPLKQKA